MDQSLIDAETVSDNLSTQIKQPAFCIFRGLRPTAGQQRGLVVVVVVVVVDGGGGGVKVWNPYSPYPLVQPSTCVHTTSHPNKVMSTCYMLFWLPVLERLVFDRSFVSMCPTHKSRRVTSPLRYPEISFWEHTKAFFVCGLCILLKQ